MIVRNFIITDDHIQFETINATICINFNGVNSETGSSTCLSNSQISKLIDAVKEAWLNQEPMDVNVLKEV